MEWLYANKHQRIIFPCKNLQAFWRLQKRVHFGVRKILILSFEEFLFYLSLSKVLVTPECIFLNKKL